MLLKFIVLVISFLLKYGYITAYIYFAIKIQTKKRGNIFPSSFWNYTSIFLISCIIPNISKNEISFSMFGSIPMFIFMTCEVGFLIWLFHICITNKFYRYFINISLISSLLFAIKTLGIDTIDEYSIEKNVDYFFIYESFFASTAAIIYFIELRLKISTEKVLENPKTLLAIGVFFCYLPPIIISIELLVTNHFGLYPEKIILDKPLYKLYAIYEWLLSSSGYAILLFFINKALNKKTSYP